MAVKKYLDLLCFTRECAASKERAAGLIERLSSCSTYGVRVWRPGRKNPSFQIASVSEPPVGFEPTTARLRIESSTTELRWRGP